MQSFIIAHSSKEKRDAYIVSYLDTHNISLFDRVHLKGEASLGIEEIRIMQKQMYLMPAKGKEKAIIVEDAQTLTTEAQNAMLKILEEPPPYALFFLSTTNSSQMLPTILSRCSLITLDTDQQVFSKEEMHALQEDIPLLFSGNISAKLSLAEKIASQREHVEPWLRQAILYFHDELYKEREAYTAQIAPVLQQLHECYKTITATNTNARMTLEHYFLLC